MKDFVVITKPGTVPQIYDFVRDGETNLEALNRCIDDCVNEMHEMSELATRHAESADYWTERRDYYEREAQTAEVMRYEDFEAAQRAALLADEPEEITEERYNEMLDVLPPLHYTTHNGYTMFCMREFLTGIYTSQYAYHKESGKYYTCIVDATDRSTWICERI